MPETICKAFDKIKSNAIGSDGISLKFIKIMLPNIMPNIMPVIEHLINFSLANGVVPRYWKSMIITPISKIKNLTSSQHCRSILIVPEISKTVERIVLN